MIPILVMLGALAPVLGLAVLGLFLALHSSRRRIRELEQEARHDPLTGLPNRRALRLHWDRMPGQKALILIDLVGFKSVNDSHGHIVGDALLKQVSARLAAAVPPPGLLARWGGDEFVAVIPADNVEAQQALIENARATPYDLSESGGPPDVCIGARTGVSGLEAELGLAVRGAARALLGSKSAGEAPPALTLPARS
ncbi:MAG: GGDEF domain-containing protein [Sandaracinobacteroides sp.]